MPFRKIYFVAGLLALSGCSAPPPLTAEQIKQMEPPTCDANDSCTVMWQRAQLWLVDNSYWKIQTANDTLLQTFNPPDASTDVAYTITREPLGGTKYRIVMRASCANIFGCSPKSPRERVIEFNAYLRQIR